MRVRTPHAGSLRFPELRQSSQGESGPKPRLRSVGDGYAVPIGQPPMSVEILVAFARRRSGEPWLSCGLARSIAPKCTLNVHEGRSDAASACERQVNEVKG